MIKNLSFTSYVAYINTFILTLTASETPKTTTYDAISGVRCAQTVPCRIIQSVKTQLNKEHPFRVTQATITIQNNIITVQRVGTSQIDPETFHAPSNFRPELLYELVNFHVTEDVFCYNKNPINKQGPLATLSSKHTLTEFEDYSKRLDQLQAQNKFKHNNVKHLRKLFGKNILPFEEYLGCAAYEHQLLVTADYRENQISLFKCTH